MTGERRLWARLVVENIEPFKGLVVSLRSDHPNLEYLGWDPNSTYPEETLCTEVVRDGVKQVFLGIMGAGKPVGTVLDLGSIEFAVRGGGQLSLKEQDLAFMLADLLAADGEVRAFSGLGFQKTYTSPTYRFELAQNYPNPFNPTTTISFSLADPSKVTLSIFDVRGSLVKTLVSGSRDAGVHRATWDATDNRGVRVSSGVYFYRLTAGSFRDTKKMVLLR